MILPSFPRFISFHHVRPQDLAEQERQFHAVTEIVRKHRETAKNKSLGPLEKTKSLLTGSVSKPCTPVVHIKIAGKWMFIPLKMVLIGIDP